MGLILAKVLYFWLLQIVEICQILHFSGQVVLISSEVRVEGLETLDYLDNLQNRERFTEQGDAITVELEVDKIYLSTPTKIAILDHERKRTFELQKDGLPDADSTLDLDEQTHSSCNVSHFRSNRCILWLSVPVFWIL
ncbi:hypothetical protein ES332_A06G174100v1 [Gossypium tomentosum]|uniref:Uncharacterized protein n=1 Tax=Gossypium tomentosum TaxID=34277 RepID=A0A5D2Q5C3_GOSTO|nr:hypothetical protein ES332_A06G174100v1 [Gossypium tomentosum]